MEVLRFLKGSRKSYGILMHRTFRGKITKVHENGSFNIVTRVYLCNNGHPGQSGGSENFWTLPQICNDVLATKYQTCLPYVHVFVCLTVTAIFKLKLIFSLYNVLAI